MPDAPRYRRSDPENESSAEIQAKLAELRKIFVGQRVKITDRGNEFEEEITGECSGFVVKTDGSFDILIKRSGFTDSR